MEKQKPQIVTIDGVEHDANTFTPEQINLLNHCIDLDRKINSTQFQMQQLQIGKDAFLKLLKDDLKANPLVEPVQDIEPVGLTD